MAESGLLTEVRWEWDGTETIADLAPGATTVTVENATTLAEDGEVWIGDSGPHLITTVDEETDTITFTPPFDPEDGEVADEGEPVVPDAGGGPAQVWLAEVILVDADTPVEIPLTVHDLSVMPEGAYDPPKAVLVSDDYERIENLPGHVPVIDGAFIDPDTLPDPTAPTEPPVNSPALTVTGTTNGLVVRADEVEATTLIAYHIIKAPEGWDGDEPLEFTPSEDTLIGEPTRSTVLVVTELPDGTALEPDTNYLLRAVASNVVGEAPPGPVAVGQLDLSNVAEVVTQTLVAGFVLAGSIQVGQITIDPDTGITIPTADGGLTHFPADGSESTMTGRLRTNDLLVENNLTISGKTNAVAGTLGLASVVRAPTSAPNVGSTYPRSPGIGADTWSLCDNPDGTEWITCHFPTNSVRRYRKSDGAFLGVLFDLAPANWSIHAITRVGNNYFAAIYGHRGENRNRWFIAKRTLSGAGVTTWFVTSNGNVLYLPAIGTDGTDVLFAWTRSGTNGADARVNTYNTDGAHQSTEYLKYNDRHTNGGILGVGRGPVGPNGEQRTWAATGVGPFVCNPDGTIELDVLFTPWLRGLTWSDGQLVGLEYGNYNIVRFNPNRWPSPVWVAYSWFDSDPGGTGTHETEPGASVLIGPSAWSWLSVSVPPAADNGNPDDPDTVRIYLNGHRQPDVPPGTRNVLYAEVEATGIAPPSQNGFDNATANPGVIRSDIADSQGPLIELRGDGAGRVGPMTWDRTGQMRDDHPFHGTVRIGDIIMSSRSDESSGFLLCDGRTLSRGDYPVLSDAIANGAATFQLPDLRRRFPIGADPASWPLGSNEGETTVVNRTPWHSHGGGSLSTGSPDAGGQTISAGSGSANAPNAPRFNNHTHNVGGSTGNALGLNNGFPNLAVNFFIRAS